MNNQSIPSFAGTTTAEVIMDSAVRQQHSITQCHPANTSYSGCDFDEALYAVSWVNETGTRQHIHYIPEGMKLEMPKRVYADIGMSMNCTPEMVYEWDWGWEERPALRVGLVELHNAHVDAWEDEQMARF